MGKFQKSSKHKRLIPVANEYLELWRDKKQKRTRKAVVTPREAHEQTKINAKPSKPNEQEVPSRLQELIQAKNRAKLNVKQSRKKRNKNELKDDFIINDKLQKGMTRPLQPTPTFKQRPHEPEKNFLRRVDAECTKYVDRVKFETAYEVNKPGDDIEEAIGDAAGNKKEKKEKKKKKTKTKLEMVKTKSSGQQQTVKPSVLKKKKITEKKRATGFEKFKDHVKFGEVAMAPPSLSSKPRGAAKLIIAAGSTSENTPQRKVANLLLVKKMAAPTDSENKMDLTGKRRDLPVATRRKLDNERERVIEIYREMKKRKITAKESR